MELSSTQESLERFRRRLMVAGGFVLVAFLILAARFFWLQVLQYEHFRTRAEDNRISLLPIPPTRGLILDRHGEVLAHNYSAYTLEITPSQVDDLEGTIDRLSEFITIEARDRRRFRRLMEDAKRFESLPLKTRLSDEEVAKFIARRYRFPGVEIKARLFRQYPKGELASHALGYLGRIAERDLARIEEANQSANYRGAEHFGKAGLEQSYEFELHGVAGYEKVEVDAGGRAVRVLSRTPPIAGNNLTLTLDAKLQEIAERAFGDRRGALVAIEPDTGGILALVSKPTFDPNLFVDGIGAADWQALNESPDKPLVNRALTGAYPPGSTFKPFMALAALHYGKRRPEQAILDPGYFVFGNHVFRDDKKGGHGLVDMYKSIVVSCDTYYYVLANDLGIDNIASFMSMFGFGAKTGVDIEGEVEGVLPSQAWKKKRFRKPEQQKWYAGETVSIAIGQGYNAYTPMQLALATATLANDGVMFRPHLVRYVTDTRTGERRYIEPNPIKKLPIKQEHLDVIKRAMVGVNKEGTGARAFAGAPYTVAGKTGTAQVFSYKGAEHKTETMSAHLRDHALYIAFAPVEKPKIALAVLVENGGFGAQAAAPIARQVLDYYLLGKWPSGAAPTDEDAEESSP
ncbi:MAG: penicillin-binding protein 2 [Rhodocyclaceae bacterium]|nr:penicillin-binding protein 2 [Rhodocyclaceae bacterium]